MFALMTNPIDPEATFGFKTPFEVHALDAPDELREHVPEVDPAYRFNPDATAAILAGFELNRRVLVHGSHGSGKSTHFEQVAARLGWPLVRVNLDGHITRLDLVGRDGIVLHEGKQVTEFQEGILPWAAQQPVALLFDELDAGRPDVMFVIQRLLERDGRFTLLDQNRVITPNAGFRLFATSNTIGQGNLTGQYHGTQLMNHAQVDRWNIVAELDYLAPAQEREILAARAPALAGASAGGDVLAQMVTVANLTRSGFKAGDLSTLMSPRTLISWAENLQTFDDIGLSFRLAFLNKCDEAERSIVGEYFQRVFSVELLAPPDPANPDG